MGAVRDEGNRHEIEGNTAAQRRVAGGSCVDCLIRSHTYYSPIAGKRPQAVASLRREVVSFPQRRMVIRQGETPSKIFTVKEGWAFRFTLMPDGRRMILSFLLPGDAIGVSSVFLGPMLYSVQSLTDLTLCGFDAGELMGELYKDRATMECMARQFVRESAEADERVLGLGRRTAGERVASLILKVTNKARRRGLAQGDSFPFPLRQEHIADALGLTAVHVSRTISILRGEGIVTLDRKVITITDRQRLIEFSGRNEALALN